MEVPGTWGISHLGVAWGLISPLACVGIWMNPPWGEVILIWVNSLAQIAMVTACLDQTGVWWKQTTCSISLMMDPCAWAQMALGLASMRAGADLSLMTCPWTVAVTDRWDMALKAQRTIASRQRCSNIWYYSLLDIQCLLKHFMRLHYQPFGVIQMCVCGLLLGLFPYWKWGRCSDCLEGHTEAHRCSDGVSPQTYFIGKGTHLCTTFIVNILL